MFEIVIDTNVYRKDPYRTGLPYKALSRLCKSKAARLHIPYIVKREFQTQQIAAHQKEMQTALAAINTLLRKSLSPDVDKTVAEIKAKMEAAIPIVVDDAANGIVKWADEIGAVVYPVSLEETEGALEAYFNGHAPLKEPKIRKDIPDAFLFQAVLTILKATDLLYVISDDGPFHDAAAALPKVKVFKTLNDFVETAEVQAVLQKQDEAEKIAKIVAKLKDEEDNNGEIAFVIGKDIGNKVTWEKIYSPSIPDDNHEASISSFGEPEDIELDFSAATYYGEGQIGIPFTCSMWVHAIYYIFKADYYALDEDEQPSVSDHNDHYFEAEDEFQINITGSVSINVDIEQFDDNKEVEDYIHFASIKLEKVTDIELAD